MCLGFKSALALVILPLLLSHNLFVLHRWLHERTLTNASKIPLRWRPFNDCLPCQLINMFNSLCRVCSIRRQSVLWTNYQRCLLGICNGPQQAVLTQRMTQLRTPNWELIWLMWCCCRKEIKKKHERRDTLFVVTVSLSSNLHRYHVVYRPEVIAVSIMRVSIKRFAGRNLPLIRIHLTNTWSLRWLTVMAHIVLHTHTHTLASFRRILFGRSGTFRDDRLRQCGPKLVLFFFVTDKATRGCHLDALYPEAIASLSFSLSLSCTPITRWRPQSCVTCHQIHRWLRVVRDIRSFFGPLPVFPFPTLGQWIGARGGPRNRSYAAKCFRQFYVRLGGIGGKRFPYILIFTIW